MYLFQKQPTKDTRLSLLMKLHAFKREMENGLVIPRNIPPPVRNSRNLSDWYRLQLDEALAMYKISPEREDRYQALVETSQSYLDEVTMGRVKP